MHSANGNDLFHLTACHSVWGAPPPPHPIPSSCRLLRVICCINDQKSDIPLLTNFGSIRSFIKYLQLILMAIKAFYLLYAEMGRHSLMKFKLLRLDGLNKYPLIKVGKGGMIIFMQGFFGG